jgi:predicted small secreted protein
MCAIRDLKIQVFERRSTMKKRWFLLLAFALMFTSCPNTNTGGSSDAAKFDNAKFDTAKFEQ